MQSRPSRRSQTRGRRFRIFIGVMQRDSKEFIDTGGWGFEEFKGDTKERVFGEPKSSCFPCHEAQKQAGYVFSDYHE